MKQIIRKIAKFIIRNISFYKTTANIILMPQNHLLVKKVALITGGTGGIGRAIAQAFVMAGATVVITGRNKEKLDMIKADLKQYCTQSNNIYTVCFDINFISELNDHVESVLKTVGHIDILINNAGILGGNFSSCTEKEFDNIINTNLKGTFFLTRIIANHMIRSKIKGNILNICSSSSLRPAESAYVISKWGLRSFTIGLAKMLIKHNIVVNGIAPGPTATPMLGVNKQERIDNKYNPLGRYAMPEEVANMAVILTSDMGRTVVGDIIYMTGGAGVITYDDISYDI